MSGLFALFLNMEVRDISSPVSKSSSDLLFFFFFY